MNETWGEHQLQCDLTKTTGQQQQVRVCLGAGEQDSGTDASTLTITCCSPKEERRGHVGILRACKEGPGIIPSALLKWPSMSSRLEKKGQVSWKDTNTSENTEGSLA